MAPSWITVRVASKRLVAEDIQSFDLVDVSGAALPAYTAGAHIDIEVRAGLVRQYSLCRAPGDAGRYRIAVLRDPSSRGGSNAMHDELVEGAEVRISAPRNHFELQHGAGRSILLGGGIGVTPLLSMAEQLCRDGRDFALHYCARSKARTAFHDEILDSEMASHVRFYFDEGDDAERLNLDAVLGAPVPDCHVYVCGPAGYIDWVFAGARERGWPDTQLHREYFSAEALASGEDDEAFDVRIASTGAVYAIPAGRAVTDVLAEHGIEIAVSCQQGVCGTCITRVLEGEPDHRDLVLMGDEMDEFTPCCSRSRTPLLVLDL